MCFHWIKNSQLTAFLPSSLEILFFCLWFFMVSNKNSAIFIILLMCVMYLSPLDASKCFQQFVPKCVCGFLFSFFILLGFVEFGDLRGYFLKKIWENFGHYFCNIFSPCYLSGVQSCTCHITWCYPTGHKHWFLFFQPFLPLCDLVWIIHIDLSSSSLEVSFAVTRSLANTFLFQIL